MKYFKGDYITCNFGDGHIVKQQTDKYLVKLDRITKECKYNEDGNLSSNPTCALVSIKDIKIICETF